MSNLIAFTVRDMQKLQVWYRGPGGPSPHLYSFTTSQLSRLPRPWYWSMRAGMWRSLIELSMRLHEISCYTDEAPTRTFSLLKAVRGLLHAL